MVNQQKEWMMQKIISEFAPTIEMFNLSSSEARLFTFLYLYGDPMTLDEMSEALGKSKTTMSTSVRSLVDANLVTRVWRKGVRKDLYQANAHLFKSFMHTSITKWIDATSNQRESLEELLTSMKEEQNNQGVISLRGRLQNIIAFHHQIEAAFQKMKND